LNPPNGQVAGRRSLHGAIVDSDSRRGCVGGRGGDIAAVPESIGKDEDTTGFAFADHGKRQIERVGLTDQMHQLAGSLSLGQQRIVEIARALCVDPMLLLLDEPAAGLRHMEKQRLAALLRELRDGGMSVLLVEHDMGFVMNLADRIVVLDFGTKIAEGTPATIKTNPEVIKAYLGVAA